MADMTSDLGLVAVTMRTGWRRVAIIGSLMLILIAGTAAFFLTRGVEGQLEDVVRTHELRGQAYELALRLVDAESGQRGYLLTRSEQYLKPYTEALGAIDGNIVRLIELTENRPEQRARIDGIVDDIDQLRAEMAQMVSLADEGQTAAARVILNTDEAIALMVRVRNAIAQFMAEEQRMLDERNLAISHYRQALMLAMLVALAAAGALAYAMFTRTQRQLSAFSHSQTKLLSHNEELEDRVGQRTRELQEARAHAERERERVEALLQEANHRIGNSLATVSSLLGLQVNRTQSDEVREALEAAQARVHAISSGHRRLRLGADLETTRADEFLSAVMEDIDMARTERDRITFTSAFEPVVINARDATTVGIILGELVTNALKHAFPDGRNGTLWTVLRRGEGGVIELCVEDNGKGLPEGGEGEHAGLGAMIIKQLARQFGGEPRYSARDGGGTCIVVPLPQIGVDGTA